MKTPYEGSYGITCYICPELATHSAEARTPDGTGEKVTVHVCEVHYLRTKLEHQLTNHRPLLAYTKWLSKIKKEKRGASTTSHEAGNFDQGILAP